VDGVVRRSRRRVDDRRAASGVANLADRDRRRAADEEVTKADQIVDRGADRLQDLAKRAAESDGVKAKLAGTLAEDAEFLRKLKPSLMKARARGEAPTDERPAEPRHAPRGPQPGKRPKPKGNGPNPFLVAGAALAVGVFLAKLIDWRGHAHPRR
jgi:hypothetical protein